MVCGAMGMSVVGTRLDKNRDGDVGLTCEQRSQPSVRLGKLGGTGPREPARSAGRLRGPCGRELCRMTPRHLVEQRWQNLVQRRC